VVAAMLAALSAIAAQAPAPAPPAAAPTAGGSVSQVVIDNPGASDRFAVPECIPRTGDEAAREACKTITAVLKDDLRFEDVPIVSEKLYAALPDQKPDAPNFGDWKSIGAQVLVTTKAEVTGGKVQGEVRVFHIGSGQSMLAKAYKTDNPRVFAHTVADELLGLLEIRGVARSRIAFVSDRDAVKGRGKEIYVMDYDGFGPKRLTVNKSINILPSFSPDGKSLGYISYRTGIPELFIAWIYEGRSSNFSAGKAQVYSHAFSPDGKKIAYSSVRGNTTDIWVANTDGSDARKLTDTAADEGSPTWSPTGREIAFVRSVRINNPQIYVMDSEGLNVRQLRTPGNYNDAPAWNPAKEYPEIAYTSMLEGGTFQIVVADVSGSGAVRQITEGRGSCEYPTWSPNGRHLAFSCERGGRWQVHVTDRMGRDIKMLAAGPGNNVYPDWGPSPAQ
jgi:TolB protein